MQSHTAMCDFFFGAFLFRQFASLVLAVHCIHAEKAWDAVSIWAKNP